MKFGLRIACVLLALACTGAMSVNTQTPVVKVLECLRANQPQTLRVDDLRIESTLAGEPLRRTSARFMSRRDAQGLRATLHLTAPADMAGMRYLLVEAKPEDALYLYLPALGKLRRVSGAGPEANVAGTSLKLSDLRLLSQTLASSSISLDAPTTVQGRNADVLRLVPAIADSPYRRVLAAVDREHCVILRAEFQNADRTLRRYQADPASLRALGRYHYASVATLDDADGSQARIALGAVRADTRLPARAFDPASFHRAD